MDRKMEPLYGQFFDKGLTRPIERASVAPLPSGTDRREKVPDVGFPLRPQTPQQATNEQLAPHARRHDP